MDNPGPQNQSPAPLSRTDHSHPVLLTEDELIGLLRIPEIAGVAEHHNVIENLKRMHSLPCIHICKTPLYPFEAVRQWILDKVEKERR
ncbi:MAG TPA: hypothetical protein PKH24_12570 [Sedimentisphaerales bacterium]|nr:hypothetical protein [Sedimentisphaerales bacterium]HNU30960.1 hypothetical protein [Sedimentisphaerales bacterium]